MFIANRCSVHILYTELILGPCKKLWSLFGAWLRKISSLIDVRLDVIRPDALNEAIEQLELYEEDSECLHPLRVNFVDVQSHQTETGIDMGGPSREFTMLFSMQLTQSEYVR